jgi:molecular chaperone HscA
MLMASIDHAEADITERLLIEKRVEGRRILDATKKALVDDGDLLNADETHALHTFIDALEERMGRTDRHALQAATDDLDHATVDFAKRRMERRIASALGNKRIDEFR